MDKTQEAFEHETSIRVPEVVSAAAGLLIKWIQAQLRDSNLVQFELETLNDEVQQEQPKHGSS